MDRGMKRTTGTIRPIRAACVVLCISIGGALLTGTAWAQVDKAQAPEELTPLVKERTGDALTRLKNGSLLNGDVDTIIKARAVQAIPDLKNQFQIEQDEVSKYSIASALVKLGDKDPQWWAYLIEGAAEAISSDTPDPQPFDLNGRTIAGPSTEYLAWAKAHQLSVEAADDKLMLNRGRILWLGISGDRRAIPLLRQALSSPDHTIQTFAALGLAGLQDKASIPLIIQVCRMAPADAAFGIANVSLARWNDPQAQAAAKEFQPVKNAN